jgi:hypothetical protein
MLNPSRTLVMSLGFVALIGLVLGLATDIGLFGWTFALLLALYLSVVGIGRLAGGNR